MMKHERRMTKFGISIIFVVRRSSFVTILQTNPPP
jgi:hypothetical protein